MLERSAQGLIPHEVKHAADDLQLAIPAEELAEFDDRPEAQHLRRLEADQALTLQLSAEGFQGPAWHTLSTALAEYGFAVIRAWISTGLIVRKCRDRGLPVSSSDDPFTSDDIRDLTQDVVAEAVIAFRDRVLAKALWNPAKGASLATFFIGMCLIKFPNVRRGWKREQLRWGNPEPLDPTVHLSGTAPSAEAVALSASDDREALQAVLRPIKSGVNRTILTLRSDGYGIDEIAELTSLSYKQVESRLFRVRSFLRARAQIRKAPHG